MIITPTTSTEPSFKPVTFTVTLESQEEVDALYQLGNYGTNIEEYLHSMPYAPKLPYDKVLTMFYKHLSFAAS